jgi:MerR family copper efflux transcriptional regulator
LGATTLPCTESFWGPNSYVYGKVGYRGGMSTNGPDSNSAFPSAAAGFPGDAAGDSRRQGPPDPGDSSLLRVGELARQTGKTTRAIRFYEELGLLEPIQRTKGGFRQYDRTALIRVYWIDRLQELGFSLPEIGEFLSALREQSHGPAAMDELRAFYGRKLIEARQAIQRMQALEAELKDSLTYLSACQSCAPNTLRSACRSCDDEAHRERPQPALVAAVHVPG